MLATDLNRGMTAGMDRVDVNAHVDGNGISHGTNQGPMRVNGEIVEPAKLIWKLKREKLMGIQWKLQGKMTKSPWSNQPKESTNNSQRFQAEQAQTEST